MAVVSVNQIKVQAFHGCMPEEEVVGGIFEVDVHVHAEVAEASANDDLSKTVDYVDVLNIVHREMAVRSKLIEHVAHRIIESIKAEIEIAEKVEVYIAKRQPPLKADLHSVSVRLEG